MNCWLIPSAMDGAAGVTAIESSCGGLTVIAELPEMLPEVAVMRAEPAPGVLARPAALMAATVVAEEAHVTVAVMFCVLLLV